MHCLFRLCTSALLTSFFPECSTLSCLQLLHMQFLVSEMLPPLSTQILCWLRQSPGKQSNSYHHTLNKRVPRLQRASIVTRCCYCQLEPTKKCLCEQGPWVMRLSFPALAEPNTRSICFIPFASQFKRTVTTPTPRTVVKLIGDNTLKKSGRSQLSTKDKRACFDIKDGSQRELSQRMRILHDSVSLGLKVSISKTGLVTEAVSRGRNED